MQLIQRLSKLDPLQFREQVQAYFCDLDYYILQLKHLKMVRSCELLFLVPQLCHFHNFQWHHIHIQYLFHFYLILRLSQKYKMGKIFFHIKFLITNEQMIQQMVAFQFQNHRLKVQFSRHFQVRQNLQTFLKQLEQSCQSFDKALINFQQQCYILMRVLCHLRQRQNLHLQLQQQFHHYLRMD